jgi:hypothetical protein
VIASLLGSAEYYGKVSPSFATAVINWGDGSTGTATVGANTIGTLTIGSAHTYTEEGQYGITVGVNDLDGTFTISGAATVNDAQLNASPFTFTVTKQVPFTNTVGTFVDGNPGAGAGEFLAGIDWGDGSTSQGTVSSVPGAGFAVTGGHTYLHQGTFTVHVSIADVGGSSAHANGTITVGGVETTGDLVTLIRGLNLPNGLSNDLVGKTLRAGAALDAGQKFLGCENLDAVWNRALDELRKPKSSLSVDDAQSLSSELFSVETGAGCIDSSSALPAVQLNVVNLVGLINGLQLGNGQSNDLRNASVDVGRQALHDNPNTCHTVLDLEQRIGRLPGSQGAPLLSEAAVIQFLLRCP